VAGSDRARRARGAGAAPPSPARAAYAHAPVDYDLDFPVTRLHCGARRAARRQRPRRRVAAPRPARSRRGGRRPAWLPALAEREVDWCRGGRRRPAPRRPTRPTGPEAQLSRCPLRLARHADAATAGGGAWHEKATELQPENPDAWYDLGLYHAIATGDQCAAYQGLNHSYTLDPNSSRWVAGGPLDVARDAVDAGACER
jgi:hypothetical protein